MVIDQTALPSLRNLAQYGSNLTRPQTALREGEELVFLFPEVKMVETSEVPARLFSMTQYPAGVHIDTTTQIIHDRDAEFFPKSSEFF